MFSDMGPLLLKFPGHSGQKRDEEGRENVPTTSLPHFGICWCG